MEKNLPGGDFKKLHKDLKRISVLEKATREVSRSVVLPLAGLFMLCVWIATSIIGSQMEHGAFIVAAGLIGGYMALNIGANDVANNIGPAVGARALTMVGALAIAAIFEAAGAILAGGDVVATVSKGIIAPATLPGVDAFIWAMLSSLLAAAVWVNLATYVGAPVSTTHAVVGGVLGAGLAAAGSSAVDWNVMGAIAASWVISPVLGGVIAALFLAFIKFAVLYKEDKIGAARRWVPVLIACMAAAFTAYLALKGFKRVWKPSGQTVVLLTLAASVASYFLVRPWVLRASARLENRRKSVGTLFTPPLIFSAALLSFAHGANDVANAIGPLSAIVDAVSHGAISEKVGVPLWVMLIGAIGISAGLALFGPKLIRTVGEQITKLNPVRAYCVSLSAAITVIAASALGLPVSSTHIAVGGVFGVGFLREFLAHADKRKRTREVALEPAMDDSVEENPGPNPKKVERRRLVRRAHLMTIIAAWVITVPCTALISAVVYTITAAMLGG